MSTPRQKHTKRFNRHFYKELVLSMLAILSIASILHEHFIVVSSFSSRIIEIFDEIVAIIFLLDFFLSLLKSSDRKQYIKHNWYLLLASIPFVDSWSEFLRGLRLLKLVRLVRAGEHLTYTLQSTQRNLNLEQSPKKKTSIDRQ